MVAGKQGVRLCLPHCSCCTLELVCWRREKTAPSLTVNKHALVKGTFYTLLPAPHLAHLETQQETWGNTGTRNLLVRAQRDAQLSLNGMEELKKGPKSDCAEFLLTFSVRQLKVDELIRLSRRRKVLDFPGYSWQKIIY